MDYFFPDREYHSALSDRQEMTEEIFNTFFYSSLKDAGIAAKELKHEQSAEKQAAQNLQATEPPF